MGNLRQYTCERVSRGYAQAVEQARWPGGWTGLGCAVLMIAPSATAATSWGYPTKEKAPQVVDLRGF